MSGLVEHGLEIVSIAKLIFKGIQDINEYRQENDKWKDIFKAIVDGFAEIYQVECEERETLISNALDEDTIYQLNELLKGKNGFEFQEHLENKVLAIIKDRFKDADRAEEYVRAIHDALLESIKKDPVFYQQYFTAKNNALTQKKLDVVNGKLDETLCKLDSVSVKCVTVDSLERSLINSSSYGVDLEFFDYGEEEIDEKIIKYLDRDNVVYIVSQSRLEATLYVARLLKKRNADNVIVVDSFKDFQYYNDCCSGYTILCNFPLENEFFINGNKLIVIKTRLEFCGHKEHVTLPGRIKSNLYSCLDKYVKDSHTITSIVQKTNGNFYALMRELFVVEFYKTPTWFEENLVLVLPALLLNTWCEKEGDKLAVSLLSNLDYDEYIKLLKPSTLLENPLVVTYDSYGGTIYSATCFVLDLPNVHMLFDNNYRKIFHEIIIAALIGDESDLIGDKFNTVDKGDYSDRLKEGMVKTLIALSNSDYNDYGLDDITLVDYVSNIVTEILDSISTANQWMNIAPLLPLLVQATPNVILLRISRAIKSEEEGFKTFIGYRRDDLYGGSRLSYLLTAIEKSLFIDGYQKLSISILMDIYKLNLEDDNNFSSKDILQRVFSSWIQEVVLTLDEKKELLIDFMQDDTVRCWKLLNSIIPSASRAGSYSYLNKPEFVMATVSNIKHTYGDIYKSYKVYLELALEYARTNLDRWMDLFKDCVFIPYGLKNKAFDKIKEILVDSLDDNAKFKLYKCIRDFIGDTRYFENRTYIKEQDLCDLEEQILAAISFNDMCYYYLYYFADCRYHDIYKVKFADNENYETRVKELHKKRCEILVNFKSKALSLAKLVELVIDDNNIGYAIAEAWSHSIIQTDILQYFVTYNKINCLKGYIRRCVEINGLDSLIKYINTNTAAIDNEIQIVMLGYTYAVDDEFIHSIQNLDKSIQDIYWSKCCTVTNIADNNLDKQCLSLLLEQNNTKCALDWIHWHDYDFDCYFKFLITVLKTNNDLSIKSYDLHMIFKKLYDSLPWEELPRSEIAILEQCYIKCFDEENVPLCIYEQLKNNPDYVVDLLCKAYNEEGAEKKCLSDEERTVAEKAWYVLYNVKFCPCVENDDVDLERLEQWCDTYIEGITKNNRTAIGFLYLGQFFARAPKNKDGRWPHKSVCSIIENLQNEHLNHNLILTKQNDRGIHTINSGREELQLAQEYKGYADSLRHKYPYVATKILEKIASGYAHEAQIERQRAQHE